MKGLHPDLEPYLCSGPMGTMIKSPLVVEVFVHPDLLERINKSYEVKKDAFDKAEAERDLSKMFVMYERPFRVELLAEYWDNLSSKEKGEYLNFVYTDSENPSINNRYWKMWFDEVGMDVMEVAEIDAFLELPETVLIHRGMSLEEYEGEDYGVSEYGISWTLDEKVAEFFANRFGKDGKVVTQQVNKSDIKALLLGRNEQEIIYYE